MQPHLTLVSHHLCPYVQRAVIALTEKAVPFERVNVDFAAKPDWFLAISPLGRTPVLWVGTRAIFESAVILEYLEETEPNPLHPADPLTRAEHRGLIELSSTALADIAGLYTAADGEALMAKARAIKSRLAQVEARLGPGLYFDGDRFSLVDAAFGPVFRYFDVLDRVVDLSVFHGLPKVSAWRGALAARPSVRHAVSADYEQRLWEFLVQRRSHLSRLMGGKSP